ncbi:hypothetical protein EDD21DRAFT_212449 [Dissophora ornata]|nr:hypothetical protein EDD21DRAFT_212449 [Dissophora ornata]
MSVWLLPCFAVPCVCASLFSDPAVFLSHTFFALSLLLLPFPSPFASRSLHCSCSHWLAHCLSLDSSINHRVRHVILLFSPNGQKGVRCCRCRHGSSLIERRLRAEAREELLSHLSSVEFKQRLQHLGRDSSH